MKKTDHIPALNILNDSYIGTILDANDPDFKGRCKIRVFGVFGQKDESKNKIPVEDLPWSYPIYDNSYAGTDGGTGRFSTPRKGSMVRVIFDRDIYHSKYIGLEELDATLKAELQNDYDGFHSLLWDNDNGLKCYHSVKGGMVIFYKGGTISLTPDNNITISTVNDTSTIQLSANNVDIVTNSTVNCSAPNNVTINSSLVHANGDKVQLGSNPIYSAINGEQLMILLSIMATSCDAKMNVTPGLLAGIVKAMQPTILSQTISTSP